MKEALLHSQKLDTVGQLTSGVAHDFNNLLSIINGYCEILMPKVAALPAAQHDLSEIHRAGIKASSIAKQILEFSRRQEAEVRVINFNTLIREVTDMIRRVGGDVVKLELRLSSDLGNVQMDPTRFQQMLMNLCFNARDAMTTGGKMTIRTYNHRERGPTGKNYVALQVIDTGHGMDEATRQRIFEPFFTTKPRGTGLGLAMLHNIVKEGAGFVTVQSAEGAGTTFNVFFPETAEPEQTIVTTLPTLPEARGTESVLLVESDLILRKMIGGILATDGYRVTEAESTAAAKRLLGKNGYKPELLVVDTSSRSGTEIVVKALRANRRLKLLSLAPSPPKSAPGGIDPSAVAHLAKPFALSAMMRLVRTLLDGNIRQ